MTPEQASTTQTPRPPGQVDEAEISSLVMDPATAEVSTGAKGALSTLFLNFFKPEHKPLGAKISRNVLYNGARLFLLAPLPFLVVPYFLKKLGTSGYGTWAVFLAISSVTSLADLGLVTTLSKHVAEFYALHDFPALNRIISTGVALYLGIACVLAALLWAGSHILITTLFRGSPVSVVELGTLWHCLILLIFANTLTMLFSSVVAGLQRMDVTTGINSLNVLCSAGFSVLFLALNFGLRGILYAYLLAAWVTVFAYVYTVRRLLPEIKLSLLKCRWAVATEILSFSLKTYITQVAVVIHNQIEKIYLARFTGVIAVGWYDISSDAALKLRGIPGLVLGPMMPAASELNALGDQRRLAQLYLRAHKYLAVLGVPLVVFVVFAARHFVALWLGPSMSIIAIPLSVLLTVNFLNLTTGPALHILVGAGKLRPGLNSAVLGMALNLGLSLFLIHRYGFQGAVIGTSLSLLIASAYFVFLFHRQTGHMFSSVLRTAYLKPTACAFAATAGAWVLMRARQVSWINLAVECIAFAAMYTLLLVVLRFFDSFDLAIAERFFPIPRSARRIFPDAELGGSLLSNSENA